jgi:TolB-like protein/tetratricopeptide (TPR) repeat protein
MKRCPECRRDYYDDSLLYCLDDGNALLEGPASADEPKTAILPAFDAESGAATRAQIRTTEKTGTFPPSNSDVPKTRSFNKRFFLALPALAVIVLGVFFGYRYFSSANSKQIESIAVMPFTYDSGNAEIEYLSDGMTETLIKSLSGLPGLDVKPRSAVFRYKGKDTDLPTIARELNVQAVLNGRVTQRGDQLTLSLELVDVKKNSVMWTEQYQRKQTDIVSLQSDIARDVSAKLTPKLTGVDETKVTKSATTDPEAYQAYLKGRYFWNRRTAEDLKKAIEQFKIATDRDSNYALAFVGLADCYAVLHDYSGLPTSETAPKAKTFAERALALDASLAEAHATLATVGRQMWRWEEAETEYKRAIEINPNYPTTYHWYSILLKAMGRNDEAAVMIKKARELDPLSSVIGVNLVELYQLQNNHAASIEICLKIIELDPNYPGAYEDLGISYAALGRHAEAVTAGEKAVELSKRAGVTLGTMGYVYGIAGKRAQALAVINELEDKYARREAIGQDMAAVYTGLGDKDKAFEWLEKDFQSRDGKLAESRFFPTFFPLQTDPRYKDLLKRMGLPE